MKRKTVQSFIVFLFSGMLIFFFGLVIFQIKVGLEESNVIDDISVLRDENSRSWAQSPGLYDIPVINKFQLFDYSINNGQVDFKLNSQNLEYTYEFDYLNRTYIPYSPGYISFYPKTNFKPNFDQKLDNSLIKQINLVAVKNFYKTLNAPPMVKVPTQLDIIIQTIQNDYLTLYFSKIIYSFYIHDETATRLTIFDLALLTKDQQDILWNDPLYGWSTEETLRPWVKLALIEDSQKNNVLYQIFQAEFNINDAQMQAMIGQKSIMNSLIRMIKKSTTDGITNEFSGECENQICTLYELATAQWSRGFLSEKQMVPPYRMLQGGFISYNDSIPDFTENSQFEFFQGENSYTLTFDITKVITQPDYEAPNSMFDLSTMKVVLNDLSNLKRIQASFNLPDDDEDLAVEISQYLEKMEQNTVNAFEESLALEGWRYISRMVDEGANLLRNAIHAKVIFYNSVSCSQYVQGFSFANKVCGGDLDFTLDAQNGLLWAEAALFRNVQQGQAFKSLQTSLSTQANELQTFLWDLENSQFAKQFSGLAKILSSYYKCQKLDQCSARELFMKQFADCSVTLNLPVENGFKDSDRVCGIGQWDIINKSNVNFEFEAFQRNENISPKITLTDDQVDILLSYELGNYQKNYLKKGGIMGYYSLQKIINAVYLQEELPSQFPLSINEASVIIKYLIKGLVNYQYGGQIISTNPINYLWKYENEYTKRQQTLDPLQGGAKWKNNAVGLFQINNNEYLESANYEDVYWMDTGIQNIQNVRKIVKTLGTYKIRSKQIVYYNKITGFQSAQYDQPNGDKTVEGTQGFGFSPQLKTDQLNVFDWDLYQNINLNKIGEVEYQGMNCINFETTNQNYDLNNLTSYPLRVTQGFVEIDCVGTIQGQDCKEYLKDISSWKNEYKVDQVSGLVLYLNQTYVYWLDLTDEKSIFFDNNQKKQNGLLPLAIRTVTMQYSKENVDVVLSQVQSLKKDRFRYFLIFLTIACLFSLIFIGAVVFYCKKKDSLEEEDESPVYDVEEEKAASTLPDQQYQPLSQS